MRKNYVNLYFISLSNNTINHINLINNIYLNNFTSEIYYF